tara:strand:- start:3369 stop:3905 length:537 start_codon:yes stop_codon:yes gene_type:complete
MDFILSVLRLVACYLLVVKNQAAWALILITNLFKILVLYKIGLPLLSISKLMTSCLSCVAWCFWHQEPQKWPKWANVAIDGYAYVSIVTLGFMSMLMVAGSSFVDKEVLIVACNLTGYLLAAFKQRFCWAAWVIYDLVLIDVFLQLGMILSAMVTMLYLPLALLGAYKWQLPKPDYQT